MDLINQQLLKKPCSPLKGLLGTTCPHVHTIKDHLGSPSSAAKVVSILDGKVCVIGNTGSVQVKGEQTQPFTNQISQAFPLATMWIVWSPCEISHRQSPLAWETLTLEDEHVKSPLTREWVAVLSVSFRKIQYSLCQASVSLPLSLPFLLSSLGFTSQLYIFGSSRCLSKWLGITSSRSFKHTIPRGCWVSQPRILHYWVLGNQLKLWLMWSSHCPVNHTLLHLTTPHTFYPLGVSTSRSHSKTHPNAHTRVWTCALTWVRTHTLTFPSETNCWLCVGFRISVYQFPQNLERSPNIPCHQQRLNSQEIGNLVMVFPKVRNFTIWLLPPSPSSSLPKLLLP